MKIKIALAVDPQGRWIAYGYSNAEEQTHEYLLDAFDCETVGPAEAYYWITAEVPLPTIGEIDGDLTSAQRTEETDA